MSATVYMKKGAIGEAAAVKLLEEKNYNILLRNYRCAYGELDIVAEIFMSATVYMKKGAIGEAAAVKLLEEKNYNILLRNYRCAYGELDIVAEIDNILTVVEVKARRPQSNVSPVEAVGYRKIIKIIRTTEYLLINDMELNGRKLSFDIVAVTLNNGKILDIQHYPDAFSSIDYV